LDQVAGRVEVFRTVDDRTGGRVGHVENFLSDQNLSQRLFADGPQRCLQQFLLDLLSGRGVDDVVFCRRRHVRGTQQAQDDRSDERQDARSACSAGAAASIAVHNLTAPWEIGSAELPACGRSNGISIQYGLGSYRGQRKTG
jgi:hypothetical protein